MEAKSHSMAAFLLGRGHKLDGARIDPGNDRPFFQFPEAPASEAREYHAIIDLLSAVERMARVKARA